MWYPLRSPGANDAFVCAIGDELDAAHQTGLPDVADVAMRRKRRKRLAQHSRLLLDRADDGAIRQQPERRKRRGAPERVARVGVTVKEMAVLVVAPEKRVIDAIGGQRRRDRKIAARQPFRDAHQIRRHAFALTREHRPRAAESRRDLIENQQRAVRAARRGGARQKTLEGSVTMPAAACTPGSRITAHTRPSARRSACSSSSAQSIEQSRRRLADRTSIAVRRRCLQRRKQDRLEDVVEQLDAADSRGAERVAVIRVAEAEIDRVFARPRCPA